MLCQNVFVVVSPTVNQTRDHVFLFFMVLCLLCVCCVCAQMSFGKRIKRGKVVTEWSNRDGRNQSQIAWLPPACFPWFSRWPPTPFDPANDEQTRVAQANWNGPLSFFIRSQKSFKNFFFFNLPQRFFYVVEMSTIIQRQAREN